MGEREIWADYYRAYAPGLFRYVLGRVGNHHDAEDIVADAFVRAAKHLDRLQNDPAYLYVVARNLIANRVTRARPETPVPDLPATARLRADSPLEEDPERAALLAQDQVEVRQALEQLTADQREALELRYFGELDSTTIGEVVGRTPGAVDVLTCRARIRLCHRLRLAQVDADRVPDRCWNEYIPRLSTHIDGKLKSPEREPTLAHLQGCEPCQTAYGAMQETGRRIRVLVPPVLSLPELAQRIEAELAASASPKVRRSAASTARRLLGAIATAATVAIVALAVPPLLARPILDVAPGSLDFGPPSSLGASSEQTITVTNQGNQPVRITALHIDGPDAAGFALVRTTCAQATVPVGGACSATFRSTPAASGSYSGTVRVEARVKPWWLP